MSNISEKSDSAIKNIKVAIAWCLAWGKEKTPQYKIEVLQEMQKALLKGEKVPEEVKFIVEEVEKLQAIPEEYCPENITDLKSEYRDLWEEKTKIGLIYGGVTKVKQYVFEAPKLPDIRGASALLDRINLVDLPAFFEVKLESKLKNQYEVQYSLVRKWLNDNFPDLSDALIPELIIYSTGGNILAFCPAAFINDLANAIEKRYTHETLTANSCAVGDCFKLLEIRFGLLRNNIEETFWLDKYRDNYQHHLIEACFGKVENKYQTLENSILENFQNHKSFNELTTKLAVRFNQRRSGHDTHNRPTRRYPPMFETHPYLKRDGVEKRSAIAQVTELTGKPYFSESSIRKRCIGDRAKKGDMPSWYSNTQQDWQPGIIESWTNKFEKFLQENPNKLHKYCKNHNLDEVETLQSLTHLSKVSNGYIAYIYADGNNMGGYIQKIRTPEAYKNFSTDVDNATKYSVYQALAEHLHPRKLQGIDESTSKLENGDFIHPFEIITIGGDDIIIIVPADKALEIAKSIGEQFEKILLKEVEIKYIEKDKEKDKERKLEIKDCYRIELPEKPVELGKIHRYSGEITEASQCKLSMSSGVLITEYKTPIYYAEKLTTQLLKSAKKKAKDLKKDKNKYYGGTVDFLSLKSVTMISSDINQFRTQGLTKFGIKGIKLKLYGAPYTLHELGGFLNTAKALKKSKFPRSQIYQIRSLLERGKHTAILNYRYFRVRLDKEKQELLRIHFEEAWCKPKDDKNKGNLAPWMSLKEDNKKKKTTYETIWREIVDIYPFIQDEEVDQDEEKTETSQQKVNQS